MAKGLMMGGGFVGLLGMTVIIILASQGSDSGYGVGLILLFVGFGVAAYGGKLFKKNEEKIEKEFVEKGKDDLLDKF